MGPVRNGYWLPLVRLSAFFAAVVVSGNLILHGVHDLDDGAASGLQRREDTYSKKKRKLERYFRSFERLFEGGWGAPSSGKVETAPPPEPAVVAESPGTLKTLAAPITIAALAAESPARTEAAAGRAPAAEPGVPPDGGRIQLPEIRFLAYADPDPALFTWPEPFPGRAPREVDLPRAASELNLPTITPGLLAELSAAWAADPAGDVGNAVLRVPELLLDSILSAGSLFFPRSGSYDWASEDSESITSRIFDLQVDARKGSIFSSFATNLVEREFRYLSRFEESHLYSSGVEDGTEEVDNDDLADEHRKIFWDALRKTYLSKYKFKPEERIRDDAFYFTQWRGVDFAVLPPLMAGYFYYRGVDKKISVGDTWLRVSLEPIEKWYDGEDDLLAGASLEWMVKGFPIGVIVTAGLYDGAFELDFVGIGTSVGMVRRALYAQYEPEDLKR